MTHQLILVERAMAGTNLWHKCIFDSGGPEEIPGPGFKYFVSSQNLFYVYCEAAWKEHGQFVTIQNGKRTRTIFQTDNAGSAIHMTMSERAGM